MKQPITLYLIGFAGTGKYTIAKGLAKSDYKVIDNHLINNPIFSLLDLDGVTPIPDNAWEAIRKIRETVLNFIIQDRASSYVFTNELLEEEYDYAIYNQVKNAAEQRGSLFVPVKIRVSLEEHQKRIENLERKERFKETTLAHDRIKKGMIKVSDSNLLELDGSNLSAKQAASAILEFIKKINNSGKNMVTPNAKSTIRAATTADISQMVILSHTKRLAYEKVQPLFWRHAEGAEDAQTKWFEFLMTKGIGIFFVAERQDQIVGFIRGQLENAPEVYNPGGATLMIDDFCVKTPDLWPTIGQQLLQELKAEAKQNGASQVVIVSGHHDEPKRQFLKSLSLEIVSEWFVGGME